MLVADVINAILLVSQTLMDESIIQGHQTNLNGHNDKDTFYKIILHQINLLSGLDGISGI